MWKAYAARAGRGEEGKKKRKMNIILYYIILYIILYIYRVVNILPILAKEGAVFADRFFFLIASVGAVSPPSPPSPPPHPPPNFPSLFKPSMFTQ